MASGHEIDVLVERLDLESVNSVAETTAEWLREELFDSVNWNEILGVGSNESVSVRVSDEEYDEAVPKCVGVTTRVLVVEKVDDELLDDAIVSLLEPVTVRVDDMEVLPVPVWLCEDDKDRAGIVGDAVKRVSDDVSVDTDPDAESSFGHR